MGVLGKGAKGMAIHARQPSRGAKATRSSRTMNATSASSLRYSAASSLLDKNTLAYHMGTCTEITMYSLRNTYVKVTTQQDINQLIMSLDHEMIAKQFFGSSAKEDFRREMKVYKSLANIYGADMVQTYTAATTINGYIGFVLTGEKPFKPMYFIINSKCPMTMESMPTMTAKDLDKMLIDVLESIELLQRKNVGHFDIKPDNIMLCGSRYKLIDWDLSHTMDKYTDRYYSSRTFTSPIAWRLAPYVLTSAALNMVRHGTSTFTRQEYRTVFKGDIMKSIVSDILARHAHLMSEHNTKQALFDAYKHTIDLYSLGMTVLFCAVKHDLLRSAPITTAIAHNMVLAKYKDAATVLKSIHAVTTTVH